MPELPEVETIVRGVRPRLLGHRFERVDVLRPDLLGGVDPERFAAALEDRTLREVRRRAKRIVLELTDGMLVITLGMTGRLMVRADAGADLPHVGVRGRLDEGGWLVYQDVRRFGTLALLSRDEWAAVEARIGPEPLGDELTDETFRRLRTGVRAPVKNWLMDQRVIAGIGNIYASEALFRAGIHPRRAAGRISAARTRRLRHEIRAVLREAIESRGTTLLDYRDAEGEPGGFARSLRVYDRAGEPCSRCDRPIRRIVQAGRSTFYCAGCQR